MKIKTSKLIGEQLDWAVAKAKGWSTHLPWDDRCVPSTDWSQGGPIIEREEIATRPTRFGWEAVTEQSDYYSVCRLFGPTALIAAMRCYVASKLGDEVEIPEELLCQ